jgi:hypothetical protein
MLNYKVLSGSIEADVEADSHDDAIDGFFDVLVAMAEDEQCDDFWKEAFLDEMIGVVKEGEPLISGQIFSFFEEAGRRNLIHNQVIYRYLNG